MIKNGLNPKQQRFVDDYIVTLNATQSAINAGYSPKTAVQAGCRLLKNERVKKQIEFARKSLSERTQVTQNDVIIGLLTEARLTGEGSSHSARVSAWTQLGKHLGMFRDKIEHTGADGAELFPKITIKYE